MRWILKLTAFSALLCLYISVINLTVLSISAQKLRWEQMNVPYGGTINALIAIPDGTLYAGVDNVGVFRSENGGNNWIKTKLTHPRVTSLRKLRGDLYDNEGSSIYIMYILPRWVRYYNHYEEALFQKLFYRQGTTSQCWGFYANF